MLAATSHLTSVSPVLTLCLHLVPLLLLIRIEKGADLGVGRLMNVHHFAVTILLRQRAILVQALHLRVFGFENALYFGLLIRCKFEFVGQLLSALCGIWGAVVPAAIVLRRRRGLVIVTTLGCRERYRDRNEAGGEKNEKEFLEHKYLLGDEVSKYMNGIMHGKLRAQQHSDKSLHNFTSGQRVNEVRGERSDLQR